MVRSFVEMILGEWGRQILYFYEANACVINSIIVIYGLIMFLAWQNLVRMYRFLVVEVAKQVHVDPEHGRKSSVKRIKEKIGVPWQDAIDTSPYPLIARLGAVIPKKKSVEALQYLLDEKDIIADAKVVLLGKKKPQNLMPSYRKMINKEIKEAQEKAAK
jgi:hypothetical protein